MTQDNKPLKIIFILLFTFATEIGYSQITTDSMQTLHFIFNTCDTVFRSDTIAVSYAIFPDENGFLRMVHPKQIIHNYKKIDCHYMLSSEDIIPFNQYVIDGKTFPSDVLLIYKEVNTKYLVTNF